jgi:hypothetical protein
VKAKNNNKDNPTYKQDDASFSLAIFGAILHEFDEYLILFSLHKFSTCFFWNEPKTPWWMVIF